MKSLKDKTVWITGASSGIGEALAYEMARAGAKVILSARNEEELHRVRKNCASWEKHIVIPLDLEKYHQLKNKAEEVWEQHGPIDVLINNGGVSQRYLAADAEVETDEKILNVNFFGAIALTHPILKKMLERNSGHFVVISSMLGLYGIQARSAYSASKHALKGYFESLRNELVKTGVRVTIVYPGYIKTQISKHALIANGTAYGKADKAHMTAIPPEHCAQRIRGAIEEDKPELIIAGTKEKLGLLVSRFLPSLFRRLTPKIEV
ncbi:SDR family oxidoreductase [Legionella micdadei]|uniref:SDR family oxidoreductase n=1 Tax=Legionella micdadei TaxID=451 RepID=UPI0009EF70C0|nr:SDR family oxidoreductase [Legionella micdadei]ARG99856.1 short chain dehydrogenase [Legionella micdadei]